MADNATLSPAAQRDGATRHRLYLVDGSGYIFRAYHALPPLTRKSDGAPVGAVSGSVLSSLTPTSGDSALAAASSAGDSDDVSSGAFQPS